MAVTLDKSEKQDVALQTTGSALQYGVTGATTGMMIGGPVGAAVGAGVGLLAGAIYGGTQETKAAKEQKKIAQKAKKAEEDAARAANRAQSAAKRERPPVGGVRMAPDDRDLAMSTSIGSGGAYDQWSGQVYGQPAGMSTLT